MRISEALIGDYIHCRHKAARLATGDNSAPSDFEQSEAEIRQEYRSRALSQFRNRSENLTVAERPISLEAAVRQHQLVLDAQCDFPPYSLTLDAVEVSIAAQSRQREVTLVKCLATRVRSQDKLTLACTGLLLESLLPFPVVAIKFVHGPDCNTSRVLLKTSKGPTSIARNARDVLARIETDLGELPPPRLNPHCDVCRYRESCLEHVTASDDLSLLQGLSPGEIENWNARGVFTVTQLAYTFRAKTARSNTREPKRHSQALQAMAIRDSTVYVRKAPELPSLSTAVFLDIEGIPDQQFNYLIGILATTGGADTYEHFWADQPDEEERIWREFAERISVLKPSVIFHYGTYDSHFVHRAGERYGYPTNFGAERFDAALYDVHRAVRTNVFFPVYSNRLKAIAAHLGSRWTGVVQSGIDSIVWRRRWEKTGSARVQGELISYNRRDCEALRTTAEFLANLSQPDGSPRIRTQLTDDLPSGPHEKFGQARSGIPEMDDIVRCAYFKYQQEKIFVRTNSAVRRSVRRRKNRPRRKLRVNQEISCSRPERCPYCGDEQINVFSRKCHAKLITDLKFMPSGVKRSCVRYVTGRYLCRKCNKSFYSDQYPTKGHRFGRGVASWMVYQHVAGRQSFESILDGLNDLFDVSLTHTAIKSARTMLASVHAETELNLIRGLLNSSSVSVDETKVAIRGTLGYVWVFATVESVVYRFTETREGTIVRELLNGYGGVLVSDFYGAYDSLECQQQKCLVHLIRDINDDVARAPFDAELANLAQKFTGILQPVVKTIDRHGLKRRHLRKFLRPSDRFLAWVATQEFQSAAAKRYQKRIGKYGARLFTFLVHDDVPWNNNVAENAVKLIAKNRRVYGASFSEQGLGEYLLFLSILQTLRRRGGSFFRFLTSGATNIDDFLSQKPIL